MTNSKFNKKSAGLTVAIDASRNRSGGAKAHLIGILRDEDPQKFGISEVHLWSYRELLDQVPDRPWLIKHCPDALNKSLIKQVFWQRYLFPKEILQNQCDILLNTDAGTVSTFKPCVTMSRDMLSYEKGEIERFGYTKARVRLLLLRYMQNSSLKRANGAVFLTNYAATIIQQFTGELKNIAIIPHGVGKEFSENQVDVKASSTKDVEIKALYVSPTNFYKHQWNVVEAVSILRNKGFSLKLELVGGGSGKAYQKLSDQVNKSDPDGVFVTRKSFVPHNELPDLLSKADLFVFASSCENMPNSLVEAMSVGLPIACSNRGPMPEVLEDGGSYFDPEVVGSIVNAIEEILVRPDYKKIISLKSKELSKKYSWKRCAGETWGYLGDVHRQSS